MQKEKLLEILKADLNSIPTKDISIEDCNKIALNLWNLSNKDYEQCLLVLKSLKSKTNKVQTFKTISENFLKKLTSNNYGPWSQPNLSQSNPKAKKQEPFNSFSSKIFFAFTKFIRDWLKKNSENALVNMCVKELKWDLETCTPLRRAKIFAISQFFRTGSGVSSFEDVIKNPFDFPREDVAFIYTLMDNLRKSKINDFSQLKKQFTYLGNSPPVDIDERIKLHCRAVEVWMCVLGCRLNTNVQADVRKIWGYMLQSKNVLKDAMIDLRAMSNRQAEFMGDDVFKSEIPSDIEWLKLCEFEPKQFTKTL